MINDLRSTVEHHNDARLIRSGEVAQVDEASLYVVGQYVSTEVDVIYSSSQQRIVRESGRADNLVTEIRLSQLCSVKLDVYACQVLEVQLEALAAHIDLGVRVTYQRIRQVSNQRSQTIVDC